jgi:DNA-binding NtrC family response regulator
MSGDSPLKDKMVLVVDDEPDILESVEEELEMCILHKAGDYELQYLLSYTFDIVILDIMGVNGFELLQQSVARGFRTVMLTAHALTPEALKKSIKLGAVSFLPKDQLGRLIPHLEDAVTGTKKQAWQRLLEKLGVHFNERFGPDWRERDKFFKEFEEELKKEPQAS